MRARVGWTSTVVVMGVLTPLPQPQARLCRGVVTFLHASFVHSAKRNPGASMNTVLWICQGLLAAVFFYSDFQKSTQSKDRMIELRAFQGAGLGLVITLEPYGPCSRPVRAKSRIMAK